MRKLVIATLFACLLCVAASAQDTITVGPPAITLCPHQRAQYYAATYPIAGQPVTWNLPPNYGPNYVGTGTILTTGTDYMEYEAPANESVYPYGIVIVQTHLASNPAISSTTIAFILPNSSCQ
jgi:hypothetical protein